MSMIERSYENYKIYNFLQWSCNDLPRSVRITKITKIRKGTKNPKCDLREVLTKTSHLTKSTKFAAKIQKTQM